MPPRKKRKASEEAADASETIKSSKKPKKELLAEARARAKQWADEEAAKKKASAPQSMATTDADFNARVDAAANNWPKKPPAKASPAAPVKVTSPEAIPKTSKQRKPSMEQKVAEARARAKAWAAGEEVDKMVVASTLKSTGFKSPARGHARKEQVVQQSVDDEVMEDFHDAEDVETISPPQKPLARTHAPAPLPFGSPARSANYKQNPHFKAQPTAEILPPSATNKTQATKVLDPVYSGNEARQQTHEQFKSELEYVQAQVIANAVAFEPSLASKVSTSHQGMYQDTQSHNEWKMRRPYLMGLSLIFVVGAGVATIVFGVLPVAVKLLQPVSLLSDLTTYATPSTKLPPCFSPHGISDTEEVPVAPAYLCDKTLPRVPCPDQGNCRDGQLYYCGGRHLQVASDGSKCVLDEASNITIAKVEVLLTNWTIQHFCSFDGVEFAHKSNIKAGCIFPLTKVRDEIEVENLILWRSELFVLEKLDDDLFIGLSDEYVDTKLQIPTTCWVGLLAVETLTTFASSTFYAAVRTISAMCNVTFAYPLASLICLAILLAIVWTRKLHESRKKLTLDVAHVREMAYERMRSDSVEHVVLHLRDGIAMDLYPTSKGERSHLILKVWPRVVTDIRSDNRVLKTNRMVGGKPRDVWQWVAPPSSKKKKAATTS